MGQLDLTGKASAFYLKDKKLPIKAGLTCSFIMLWLVCHSFSVKKNQQTEL